MRTNNPASLAITTVPYGDRRDDTDGISSDACRIPLAPITTTEASATDDTRLVEWANAPWLSRSPVVNQISPPIHAPSDSTWSAFRGMDHIGLNAAECP